MLNTPLGRAGSQRVEQPKAGGVRKAGPEMLVVGGTQSEPNFALSWPERAIL